MILANTRSPFKKAHTIFASPVEKGPLKWFQGRQTSTETEPLNAVKVKTTWWFFRESLE